VPIHNADIAAAFGEIADLLEIRGDNPFRIHAYRNAARVIGEFGRDIKTLFDQGGELPKLQGVGADLAGKIHELAASGRCGLQQLRRGFPAAVTALLRVTGLGPKRVRPLYHVLNVRTPKDLLTPKDLRKAAREGRIRDVPGFGEKTGCQILAALQARPGGSPRAPGGCRNWCRSLICAAICTCTPKPALATTAYSRWRRRRLRRGYVTSRSPNTRAGSPWRADSIPGSWRNKSTTSTGSTGS
jgi:Helix-hairpin-helix domain